jgi:hypothetical protein
MPDPTRAECKAFFNTGDIPTEAQMHAFVDAIFNMVQAAADAAAAAVPVLAKAAFTGQGGNGVCAIANAHNIASVTRNGAGRYDVLFTAALPDSNYQVVFGIEKAVGGGTDGQVAEFQYATRTVNGFSIYSSATGGGADYADDPTGGSFVVV